MKLTRNLFIPFLDTSGGTGKAKWVPVDLSEQFEFAYNPNTETRQYICYKNDSTEVTGYAPELPQEIVLDNSNEMYKFIFEHIQKYPTGSDASLPLLLVFPDLTTGKPTRGQMWDSATVVGDTLNTVDGKLSFTISPNGDPVDGTVSGIGTDTVVFTAGEAA